MAANRWSICPKCVAESGEFHDAETLREDWEIEGPSEGSFAVHYCCQCEECGFEFSFSHRQQVNHGALGSSDVSRMAGETRE